MTMRCYSGREEESPYASSAKYHASYALFHEWNGASPACCGTYRGAALGRLLAYLSANLRCLCGFQKLKTLDLTEVSGLIVVDTHQADRLDRLQDCLRNPGLAIHLYDHHPDAPGDLRGILKGAHQHSSLYPTCTSSTSTSLPS